MTYSIELQKFPLTFCVTFFVDIYCVLRLDVPQDNGYEEKKKKSKGKLRNNENHANDTKINNSHKVAVHKYSEEN